MNRRRFLASTALALGGLGLVPAKLWSTFSIQESPIRLLRDRVGLYSQSGGTLGVYMGQNDTLVIDSQYPDNARAALAALKAQEAIQLGYVCNTHHHGDHVGGNDVFNEIEGVAFIAHKEVPALMKAQAESRNRPLVHQPNQLFEQEMMLELGNERLHAKHFGPAHTGGDAVYHFENANIAHVGDLVFNGVYPFIDPNGGGSIRSWIEVLEAMEAYYDQDTLFIFGHGVEVTGGIAQIQQKRAYLNELLDSVSKAIGSGQDKESYLGSALSFERKEMWEGAKRMNMERAWDEIKATS